MQVACLLEHRPARLGKLLEPADIAQIISEAPRDRIPLIFRVLPKDLAAESFTFMDGYEEGR